jgi:hypothetical protein
MKYFTFALMVLGMIATAARAQDTIPDFSYHDDV